MPIGCSIFSANSRIDLDSLNDDLSSYESKTSHEDLDKDLRTTVENIESTDRGLAASVYYDQPIQLGSRPGENPWAKNTVQANVRFVNESPLNSGFISIGPKRKRNQTRSEVADILGVHPEDDIDLVGIDSQTLAQVVADDSKDSTFGWWEDVDADTTSASVTGDIESSTHARKIDKKGKPTWVVFISERYNRKVGVSRDNVVFYGEGWDHETMEDYIFQIILSKIYP